jgi:hypothetical protein
MVFIQRTSTDKTSHPLKTRHRYPLGGLLFVREEYNRDTVASVTDRCGGPVSSWRARRQPLLRTVEILTFQFIERGDNRQWQEKQPGGTAGRIAKLTSPRKEIGGGRHPQSNLNY